jgi:hypothetical protein
MTTRVHEPILHRPSKRPTRLIWTLLAVAALAAAVIVVVLLTTGTSSDSHPAGPGTVVGNSGTGGHVPIDQCRPTHVVHPC